MKTTKKQKKSNLKVSLLLLLLAAVLLISSTYAWFIANNTATISVDILVKDKEILDHYIAALYKVKSVFNIRRIGK